MSTFSEIKAIARKDDIDFLWRATALGILSTHFSLSLSPENLAVMGILSAWTFAKIQTTHRHFGKYLIPSHKEEHPKEAEELRAKLQVHAEAMGLKSTPGILVARNEQFPNADVKGIVDPHIVVTEPLLENLDPEEIEAAGAHELGHVRTMSKLKGMILGAEAPLAFYGSVGVFGQRLSELNPSHSLPGLYDAVTQIMAHGSPHELSVAAGVLLAVYPLSFYLDASYRRNNELRSDKIAAKVLNGAKPLVDALKKVKQTNLEIDPDYYLPEKQSASQKMASKFFLLIHADHPTAEKRIKAMQPDAPTP